MNSASYSERLRQPADEALERHAEMRVECERHRDGPPRPGDLFVFAETAELGVLWVVVEHGSDTGHFWDTAGLHRILMRFLSASMDAQMFSLVAADSSLLVGTTDVAVPAEHACGALCLRCAFEIQLTAKDFESAECIGILGQEILERIFRKRTEISEGRLDGSMREKETDRDPEYQDWMAEGLGKAQALLVATSSARGENVQAPAQIYVDERFVDTIDFRGGLDGTALAGDSAGAEGPRHVAFRPSFEEVSFESPPSESSEDDGDPDYPLESSDEGDRLVAELREGGNREAIFRRLYGLYSPRIYASMARRNFSADECSDLVQETFLRVVRGIEGYGAQGQAKFSSWVSEVAENVCQQELRSCLVKQRSAEFIPQDNMDSFPNTTADSSSEKKCLEHERKRLLHAEVEKMPPQMRRAVLLSLQGHRYREIAVLMHISINTVKAQLGQAKIRLKRSLGGYFEGSGFEISERGRT
jgi:RNA polymerase sigma factor (sigma-70 family)